MIRLFTLVTLLLLTLGCERLENTAGDTLLTCGIETADNDRLLKIESVGELDAVFMAFDGAPQKIQPTVKNCLLVPNTWKGTLFVRDKKNQGQGLSIRTENLSRGVSILSLSPSDRLVQSTRRLVCPNNEVVQHQLIVGSVTADAVRAQLPSARITLFNDQGSIMSRNITALNEATLILPLVLDEGRYRLFLENFDGFDPQVLEPGLTCDLIVDRSPPRLVGSRMERIEVNPGQLLEFPIDDATASQLFLCPRKRANEDQATAVCQESEFLPAFSYVAPEDGVWDVYYFAKDQAGNVSPVQHQVFAVFHRDVIEQIKLLSKELKRLASTTTQQYKVFKTYQKLVHLAKKLTLKAEIKEVYWKLLGNFATVSSLTLVARERMPDGPGVKPSAVEKTAMSPHSQYPYRVTITRSGLQHNLRIFDTRYPNMKPLGMSLSADATENSLGAILRFHPKFPYLYVSAGRFLLKFDLRAITYVGSGDNRNMQFMEARPYREAAAESVITDFELTEDGRLVSVSTLGGWVETHALNSANQSLWHHEKICGVGACRYYAERRTSVAYDSESRAVVWQSDMDELERRLESPVDLYDVHEIDSENVLLVGKNSSLFLWKPKLGSLENLGVAPMKPYISEVLAHFQAVLVGDVNESVVLRKTDQGWTLLNQTFRGRIFNEPHALFPIFQSDDGFKTVVGIYDRDFKLRKSITLNTSNPIFLKSQYLYYESAGFVQRMDTSSLEELSPLPLPQGYALEFNNEHLVFKRWDVNENTYAFYEWMPADGSLVRIDSSKVHPQNNKGTIVDADGESFFLSSADYIFFDDLNGIHLDRDSSRTVYKDVFVVDPDWFDQQLQKRPFYHDAN